MKKILITLIALFLLASCNNDIEKREVENKENNINTEESINEFDEKIMEEVVEPLLEVN